MTIEKNKDGLEVVYGVSGASGIYKAIGATFAPRFLRANVNLERPRAQLEFKVPAGVFPVRGFYKVNGDFEGTGAVEVALKDAAGAVVAELGSADGTAKAGELTGTGYGKVLAEDAFFEVTLPAAVTAGQVDFMIECI